MTSACAEVFLKFLQMGAGQEGYIERHMGQIMWKVYRTTLTLHLYLEIYVSINTKYSKECVEKKEILIKNLRRHKDKMSDVALIFRRRLTSACAGVSLFVRGGFQQMTESTIQSFYSGDRLSKSEMS